MRETYQILLTSNCDASLLLFCDRAYRQATAAVVAPIHVPEPMVEVEAARAVVVADAVRSRTPIVAVFTVV